MLAFRTLPFPAMISLLVRFNVFSLTDAGYLEKNNKCLFQAYNHFVLFYMFPSPPPKKKKEKQLKSSFRSSSTYFVTKEGKYFEIFLESLI